LDSYEGQNEDWYGFETDKKEEEKQADTSDSEARRRFCLFYRCSAFSGHWVARQELPRQ